MAKLNTVPKGLQRNSLEEHSIPALINRRVTILQDMEMHELLTSMT
jgi:hypothetical protein